MLWAAPFLLAVLGFEVLPVLSVLAGSFVHGGEWSLGNYAALLSSRFYRGAFATSVNISLLTSAIGLGVGLPERLEHVRKELRLDAGAGIAHFNSVDVIRAGDGHGHAAI